MFDLNWYRRLKIVLDNITNPRYIVKASHHELCLARRDQSSNITTAETLLSHETFEVMRPEEFELYNYIVKEYIPYFGMKIYDHTIPHFSKFARI